MVDADIVYAKIGIIQRCLHRIQSVTKLDPKNLDDLNIQDVFILNLQRAAQAAIDLAAHLVACEGLGVPSDLKEHFSFLRDAGILSKEVTEQMKKMVGFRNIAVHEYQNLDINILKTILTGNLKNLENFYTSIVKHFHLSLP